MPTLKVSRVEAIQKLEKQVDEGIRLANLPIQDSEHLGALRNSKRNWEDYTIELLGTLIIARPAFENLFEGVGGGAIRYNASHSYYASLFRNDMKDSLSALNGLIRRVGLFDEPISTPTDAAVHHQNVAPRADNNFVFIVHGHNGEAKHAVARFLQSQDLEPKILDELPGGGRTLIEKFEHYSDQVGYAIVLLTPDDEGRSKAGGELQDRARQNVVFELGYFAAKLSRRRVCAMYMGVEIPSDYSGVEYIFFDRYGGWKAKLAGELREAGYAIDMNRL